MNIFGLNLKVLVWQSLSLFPDVPLAQADLHPVSLSAKNKDNQLKLQLDT